MIQNYLKQLIRKFIRKIVIPNVNCNYSQFGEDLIIANFFYQMDIQKPIYLDIGANEPQYLSNTFYFYERGANGVLIEPNPYLAKKLLKQRPKDKIINCGIGINNQTEADYYLFPNKYNGLNTFSHEEAMHWKIVGMKGIGKFDYEKVLKIPLIPINKILEKYFNDKAPNFISLDVEGMDLDILKSMDFKKWKPELICVETLLYDNKQKGFKNNNIIEFMLQNEYAVYADTWVNTIFCRKDLINNYK